MFAGRVVLVMLLAACAPHPIPANPTRASTEPTSSEPASTEPASSEPASSTMSSNATFSDPPSSDPTSPDLAAPPPTAPVAPSAIAWRRVDLPNAGISIDQHPDWPAPDDAPMYYQRAPSDSEIVVRWGTAATIDNLMTGLALARSASPIHIDAASTMLIDGIRGLCVKIRFHPLAPVSHAPAALLPAGEQILVYVGFHVGATPVLVGYQGPAAEITEIEPLAEHILFSIKRL
jgi:hypothetical protein